MVRIDLATRGLLSQIASFYLACGYDGGVSETDTVLVAYDATELIGAVRLCLDAIFRTSRYQSFVDPAEPRPYITRLEEYLKGYAGPQVCFVVHGISPPDRYLNPLTVLRCAAQIIRNAIQPGQEGYDALSSDTSRSPGRSNAGQRWSLQSGRVRFRSHDAQRVAASNLIEH